MKKIKKKNKHYLLIILGIIVIMVCIFILNIPKSKTENHEEYNSLKELLERFECTFISEKKSTLEDVEYDIYLKFGNELNLENERYFIDIVQSVAKFKIYQNFRLIDEENQIEIVSISNEQKTVVVKIYINGDSNYFGTISSLESLQYKEEEKYTKMDIKSKEIKQLIENEWIRADVDFGTRETIYEDYYYYFDEGIEVRTISSKVYNIIFRNNYQDEILNGITTNMSQESIINRLGTPTFGELGSEIIGYKGVDIYIFFTNSGVSVYRTEKFDSNTFIDYVKNIPENLPVDEFISNITDIWYDYDKYEYSLSNYICLRYSLKGIQIQFNMENNNGIIFYNNYNGNFGENLSIENMKNDNTQIPEMFYFENRDLVYVAELERYDEEQLMYSPSAYKSLENQSNDEFYYTIDKKDNIQKNLRVISKKQEYANSDVELDVSIISALWIDDENLVYSVKEKGLYIYNAKKYTKKQILNTTEECQIKYFSNGKLYYNDKSININNY